MTYCLVQVILWVNFVLSWPAAINDISTLSGVHQFIPLPAWAIFLFVSRNYLWPLNNIKVKNWYTLLLCYHQVNHLHSGRHAKCKLLGLLFGGRQVRVWDGTTGFFRLFWLSSSLWSTMLVCLLGYHPCVVLFPCRAHSACPESSQVTFFLFLGGNSHIIQYPNGSK